jgi:hypothetical protein
MREKNEEEMFHDKKRIKLFRGKASSSQKRRPPLVLF